MDFALPAGAAGARHGCRIALNAFAFTSTKRQGEDAPVALIKSMSRTLQRQVDLTTAVCQERLLATHVRHVLALVDLVSDRMPFDDALDIYVRILRLTPEQCLETTGLRVDEVVEFRYTRHPWTAPDQTVVTAAIVERLVEQGAYALSARVVAERFVNGTLERAHLEGRTVLLRGAVWSGPWAFTCDVPVSGSMCSGARAKFAEFPLTLGDAPIPSSTVSSDESPRPRCVAR